MRKPITIEVRTTMGEPVEVGDVAVTPESQAVILAAAFRTWQAAVVWNRSAAVLVNRNGEQVRIPIVNLSRIGAFAAVGLGIAASLLLLRVNSLLAEER